MGLPTTQEMDLAYDPEQNPEERRRVRRDYRDLAKETESQSPPRTRNDLILIHSQMLTLLNTLQLKCLDGCIRPMTFSAKVQKSSQQSAYRYC